MFRLLITAIISTFLVIPIAGFTSYIIRNEVIQIIVTFTTGYLIVPAVLLKFWPAKQFVDVEDTLESALENGLIVTREYSVSEVVEVEEFEDEGSHYLFSISPSTTLSLFGQYIYPYNELSNFPSNKMRLFVHKKNNLCYGIECIGEKLEKVSIIEPPSSEAWEADVVPYDLDIIEKPISEVVSQIQRYT